MRSIHDLPWIWMAMTRICLIKVSFKIPWYSSNPGTPSWLLPDVAYTIDNYKFLFWAYIESCFKMLLILRSNFQVREAVKTGSGPFQPPHRLARFASFAWDSCHGSTEGSTHSFFGVNQSEHGPYALPKVLYIIPNRLRNAVECALLSNLDRASVRNRLYCPWLLQRICAFIIRMAGPWC